MVYRVLLLIPALVLLLSLPAGAVDFDATLARFERYAVEGMKDWKVPGMAVAVVRGNSLVYAKGFGTKRYGTNRPVDKDTVFQVGSTTKSFTVALMATLVDEGKIGWDDRVIDHFPGFQMYDPWVTREFRIHDLFAQHSGMPAYAGDLQALIGFDRDHIIRSMRHIKPVTSFRDTFAYVNNLFVAGAKVIELKTGKSWETLMQERILDPLGMNRSSMAAPGLTDIDNGSDLHILVNGTPQPIAHGSLLLDWPYVYGPAGGLNSSASDMARWVATQLHNGMGVNRIFSKESAKYMHTPRTPVQMGDTNGAYCQGWLTMQLAKTNIVWHNGGTSGINSFMGFSPDLDMAVVVLTNLGSHKLADALGMQFFDMMSGVEADWSGFFLKGKDDESEIETPPSLPGLAQEAYAGTYHSPIYGELTASAERKGLLIRMGAHAQLNLLVKHQTMHTFAGDWIEIDPADPEYHFDFDVDTQGNVVAVTIREFNEDGTCTFVKK